MKMRDIITIVENAVLVEIARAYDRTRDVVFYVHRNPNPAEFRAIMRKSARTCLRCFITPQDFLAWDSEHIHDIVEYTEDASIQKIVNAADVVRAIMIPEGVVFDELWTEEDGEYDTAVSTIQGNAKLIAIYGNPVPVLSENRPDTPWVV